MDSTANQDPATTGPKHYPPSRPGIKFILCAIAAVIAIFAIIATKG